jgi:hypothetical protein
MILHLTAATLITAIMIMWLPPEQNLSKTPSRELWVLQTCLQALHMEPGAADGRAGPRTKAALDRWLRDCFGDQWRQDQPIAALGVALEAHCHAALYKTEVPINFRCHR